MVKNTCSLLFLIIISSCCFKNINSEREDVWFEEHPITAREVKWVENGMKWYEPYVLDNFFDRNGVFISYNPNFYENSKCGYLFFFEENLDSVETCYLEKKLIDDANQVKCSELKCSKIDIPLKIGLKLNSINYSSLPVVVGKSRYKASDMSPFPKMGIMKRTTKGKEYAWLYDLRVCLKQNCDDSSGTVVPEHYKNNVFLYDMALYLHYEVLYREGNGTEQKKDSVYHLLFQSF